MSLYELVDNKSYISHCAKYMIVPIDGVYTVLSNVHLGIEKFNSFRSTFYVFDHSKEKDFVFYAYEMLRVFVGDDLKKLIKEFHLSIEQISLCDIIESFNVTISRKKTDLDEFKKAFNITKSYDDILGVQIKRRTGIKKGDFVWCLYQNQLKKAEVQNCNSNYINILNSWIEVKTRDSLKFGLTEEEALENHLLYESCELNFEKVKLDFFQNIYNNYVRSVQNILDFEREFDKSN